MRKGFYFTLEEAVKWRSQGKITTKGLIAVYLRLGGDPNWQILNQYIDVPFNTYRQIDLEDVEDEEEAFVLARELVELLRIFVESGEDTDLVRAIAELLKSRNF